MLKKPLFPIVPRRSNLTGRVELFFMDGEGHRRDMGCYDPMEGHSGACWEYYLKGTKPDKSPEALALFESYMREWEGESLPVLRSRLSR